MIEFVKSKYIVDQFNVGSKNLFQLYNKFTFVKNLTRDLLKFSYKELQELFIKRTFRDDNIKSNIECFKSFFYNLNLGFPSFFR